MLDLAAGRSSVREALRLLAAHGLVTFEMHRGARVRRFTRAECLSLIQVREVLEGLAAALAARRASAEDLARLSSLHRRAADAIAHDNPALYLQINDALHEAILDISGNGMIGNHLSLAQLSFFRVQTRFLRADDLVSAQAEHADIIVKITRRDERGAEDAMRQHIRATREVVLQAPPRFFEQEAICMGVVRA